MRPTPLLVQLTLVALWLGAAILFAAIVAPALFATLPTRSLAGMVVSRVLPAVFYSGMVVGAIIIVLELRENGAWSWRGAETPAAITLLSCAIAQFIISPRIERIRGDIGGAIESLAVDDPRRVQFGRLHGASVAWLGLAMIAAAAAGFLAARKLKES